MRASETALLVTLAACFNPHAPAGALCAAPGAAERCPSGQQCVAHDGVETCELMGALTDAAASDSAGDGSSVDGDRDGDGVRDSVDNCPDSYNPTQDDEDGDHVGDACDPCPPFADNTDGDGDGVGDACDPNPATPGDKLVAFEGFASSPPGIWTPSGSFTVASGDAVLNAGDGATSTLTIVSPSATHVEIRAALAVDKIAASTINLGSINVIDQMQPGTDKSIGCQLSGLANGTQEELRIYDGSTSVAVKTTPHAFSAGTQTELRLRRSGTSYDCHATGPSQDLTGTAAFSPASPRMGLRVHGAKASFHWVMLVQSP
jgi:hypothetical protein